MSYLTTAKLTLEPSRAKPFEPVSVAVRVQMNPGTNPASMYDIRIRVYWEVWPPDPVHSPPTRIIDATARLPGWDGYERAIERNASFEMWQHSHVSVSAAVEVKVDGRWTADNWDSLVVTLDDSGPYIPPDGAECEEGKWFCVGNDRVVCRNGQWVWEPNSRHCIVEPPPDDDDDDGEPPYTPPPRNGDSDDDDDEEERDWLVIGMTAAAIGMVGFAVVSLLKPSGKPGKEERKLLPPPRKKEGDETPMYRRAAELYGYGRS